MILRWQLQFRICLVPLTQTFLALKNATLEFPPAVLASTVKSSIPAFWMYSEDHQAPGGFDPLQFGAYSAGEIVYRLPFFAVTLTGAAYGA
jgi:hypothetical protein